MRVSTALIITLALVWLIPATSRANEFVFARLMYGGGYDGWPRWQADWPEAETHFSTGLDRLTSIDVAAEGVVLRMAGTDVFDYPWIYVVEVGFLSLAPDEIAQLREYLLRGGFLMVDDFHGQAEWQQFEYIMSLVFPDRAIEELSNDSEIFHVVYDLAEREQIPGIRAWLNNQTWEKGGRHPHWRGIVDDQGRVMVAVNFNQDLGDAWEHADDVRYPARLTTQAYRLGINYVVYALTH
ncbi:DUF4159 domain-containing protein [Granulosicoccus sp. 3-233]|uniref:DUF4159 domain-containing protein n=1 Tax=Granulosicoccus sp. 3-233 TaxID=3417969 RepID=UPI003D340164